LGQALTGKETLFSCAPQGVGPPLTGEETKRIIEVEAVDQTLLYRCQSIWSAEKFSKVSENDLKARFKEKYNVDAREFEFSFEPANHSRCCQGGRHTAEILKNFFGYG